MILYHMTSPANLPSIMTAGLLVRDPADSDPSLGYQPVGVYLWRHYADAVGMRQDVIITVDIPEHWVTDDWEFDSDDDGNSCAVRSRVAIPPSRIVAVSPQEGLSLARGLQKGSKLTLGSPTLSNYWGRDVTPNTAEKENT